MKMKKSYSNEHGSFNGSYNDPVSTGYGRRRRKGLLPQLQTRARMKPGRTWQKLTQKKQEQM